MEDHLIVNEYSSMNNKTLDDLIKHLTTHLKLIKALHHYVGEQLYSSDDVTGTFTGTASHLRHRCLDFSSFNEYFKAIHGS